jgi:HAE1 family hydrophobic/amphiphilic exporter-1
MAIAVTGGLIASTLLSLVFVPAVFTLADDTGRLAWRLLGRFVGATDETAHAPQTRPAPRAEPEGLPAAAE